MPRTEHVSEDMQLALVMAIGHAGLMFLWLVVYALLDGFAFDETITAGVNFDELQNEHTLCGFVMTGRWVMTPLGE
jgi:hypothetical protein